MDSLRLDLIYALRGWRRRPFATAAAIAALALGIGANSTVFSFVSGVLIRPLPYADPSRLVMLWQDRSGNGGPSREVISPGLFVDWNTRATAVTGVAAIRNWSPNLTGVDANGRDEPERLTGATVSAAYFDTLGVPALAGRTFNRDDDRPGAPLTVVVSEALWRRKFANNATATDTPDLRTRPAVITIDGAQAEIIGVMPASFHGAVVDADIWNTMRIDPANAPRGLIMLRALARLAPGVSLDQAQAAMASLQTTLQSEDAELTGARARVVGLHEDLVGPVRPVLLVLFGSVAMVWLIACANVAGLLMARATQRRAEISMRVALGADRARLVRQLLAESSLLALAGSAVGLALAYGGVRALVAMAPPSSPRLQDVHLDLAVVAFTAALTAVAALVVGLAPAATTFRASVAAGAREGTRDARGGSRSRAVIVAVEVATAMTLVVGAALFVRSLISLQRVDLGFVPDRVLTASISPPRGSYRGDDAVRQLFDRVLDRAARLPGVAAASMTSVLPLSGMQINFNFRIDGRPPGRTPNDEPVASMRSVGPTYFSTMGMRLIDGRGFTAEDRAEAPLVAIVNRALVKRYWPGQSPIGARIAVNGSSGTIVGVIEDVHHIGPAATPDGEMYVPYVQLPARGGWIVLRTTGDPNAAASALRAAMHDVDPSLPLASMRPMSTLVANSVAQPRFLATVLTGFSAIAAALALLGVYSLLAFSVSQRSREIGVRIALGASRTSVLGLVLRQSLAVVTAGVVVGAAAGAMLSRVVKSLLFDVAPGDPAIVAAMAAAILVASLVASYLPARRAASIDPLVALRD